MKANSNYRAKRIAITAAVIVALFGSAFAGTYFYMKGNESSQATGSQNEQGQETTTSTSDNLQNPESQNNPEQEGGASNSGVANNGTEGQTPVTTEVTTVLPSTGVRTNTRVAGTTTNGRTTTTTNVDGTTISVTLNNDGTTTTTITNPDGTIASQTTNATVVTETEEIERLISENMWVGWTPERLNIPDTASKLGIKKFKFSVEKTSTIKKAEGNKDSKAELGDIITYRVIVKNEGNADLKGIVVTDEKLNKTETIDVTVAEKSKVAIEADYKVSQENVNAQEDIYNKATASYKGQVKEAEEVVQIAEENKSYSVEKTSKLVKAEGNKSEKAELGDTIKYTVTVYNKGNVDLNGIKVTDEKLNKTATVNVTVAEVKKVAFEAEYKVTQEDVNAQKEIYNKVTATFEGKTEEGEDKVPVVEAKPSYEIIKTATLLKAENNHSDKAEVNDTIEYTIKIRNTGNITLQNIVVEDLNMKNENGQKMTTTIDSLAPSIDYIDAMKFKHLVTSNDIQLQTSEDGTQYASIYNKAVATAVNPTEPTNTIKEEAENELIAKDTYKYIVEYYHDSNKTNSVEFSDVKLGTNITSVDTESYKQKGYKLDSEKGNGTGIVGMPLKISVNESENVIRVYYVKDSFGYKVQYYYENANGDFEKDEAATETYFAEYKSTITTYEEKTRNNQYVFDHITPVDKNGNLALTIDSDVNNNIINVYYVRNSFKYKVVYYKDSVKNENKLGETEQKEQKIKTVMTNELVSKDFGENWINAKKPNGYKDGEVQKYITIEKDENNNIINVVYKPRTDIPYTIKYYFNKELDSSKTKQGTGTLGTKVNVVDYSNNGEWSLVANQAVQFTIAPTGNVFEVYYVKPDISVVKISTPSNNETVEYGDIITYTLKATNNGYKEGTVKISDSIPVGTVIYGDINATGLGTITEDSLNAGVALTVPAKSNKAGEASITFKVKVTSNVNNTISNTAIVNEKTETNITNNPVEKTVTKIPQNLSNSNIVIVIDTSLSMSYAKCPKGQYYNDYHWSCDGCSHSYYEHKVLTDGNGNKAVYHVDNTMINAAKTVANNLIDKVSLSASGKVKSQVAVVQFDNKAVEVGRASYSSQKSNLKTSVTNMETDSSTEMGAALQKAKNVMDDLIKKEKQENGSNSNQNIVIFLSDGKPTDSNKSLINTYANSLKSEATIYTIGFGSDADKNVLQNTIATDTSKYYAANASLESLTAEFTKATDDINKIVKQTTLGLLELDSLDYANVGTEKPITVIVNNNTSNPVKIESISSEYIKKQDGKYYLDVSKFNAGDSLTVRFFQQ